MKSNMMNLCREFPLDFSTRRASVWFKNKILSTIIRRLISIKTEIYFMNNSWARIFSEAYDSQHHAEPIERSCRDVGGLLNGGINWGLPYFNTN